jgi:hypothetical protein
MRKLASYSFTVARDQIAIDVHQAIDDWLSGKGEQMNEGKGIVFRDGRIAALSRSMTTSSQGDVTAIALTEPTPGGTFRTSINLAETDDTVAVAVHLEAGAPTLAPLSVDVHCPQFIRTLLASQTPWTYKDTQLSPAPIDYLGQSGGDSFLSLVWSTTRALPIVAISDEYGAVLHPGIVEDMARDLAGLACVARLDPAASWRITKRKGKAWSCYGGAIRIYWPNLDRHPHPLRHSLWTPRRLLYGVADTETAAGRIRSQLRRRVLGQSAFGIQEPTEFERIRRAARQDELASLRARAEEHQDYKTVAEEQFAKLAGQADELDRQADEIRELKDKVASLELALQWRDHAPDIVEPEEEPPPATVEEAVLTAMDRYEDQLVFGAAVNDGIRSLATDAGPPDKIMDYLEALAELTKIRRAGSIGNTAMGWLDERGVIGSVESETVRNSSQARAGRTWDDGCGAQRFFECHLKPSEATSPDRCVRVYFDYDAASRKTIIGWVGRHP